MGRTYLFECSKCGYRTKVAGGADRGVSFAVQTLLCRECKELYDSVTAWKVAAPGLAGTPGGLIQSKTGRKPTTSPPSFLVALNRLPLAGAARSTWVHFKLTCPVSDRHRIREWRSRGKCPKCGCYLEQNAIPFRIWD
jgi:hypothetical protein